MVEFVRINKPALIHYELTFTGYSGFLSFYIMFFLRFRNLRHSHLLVSSWARLGSNSFSDVFSFVGFFYFKQAPHPNCKTPNSGVAYTVRPHFCLKQRTHVLRERLPAEARKGAIQQSSGPSPPSARGPLCTSRLPCFGPHGPLIRMGCFSAASGETPTRPSWLLLDESVTFTGSRHMGGRVTEPKDKAAHLPRPPVLPPRFGRKSLLD